MSKDIKIIITVVTILSVAFIVMGVVLFFENNKLDNSLMEIKLSADRFGSNRNSNGNPLKINSANVDKAGWNEYTNNRYGYSIQFPKNWYIESDAAENDLYYDEECEREIEWCIRPNGAPLEISNYPDSSQYYNSRSSSREPHVIPYPEDYEEVSGEVVELKDISLNDYMVEEIRDRGLNDWSINKQDINLNGAQGLRYIAISNDRAIVITWTTYFLPIPRSDNIFILTYKGDNPILGQVVSTFKFKN